MVVIALADIVVAVGSCWPAAAEQVVLVPVDISAGKEVAEEVAAEKVAE